MVAACVRASLHAANSVEQSTTICCSCRLRRVRSAQGEGGGDLPAANGRRAAADRARADAALPGEAAVGARLHARGAEGTEAIRSGSWLLTRVHILVSAQTGTLCPMFTGRLGRRLSMWSSRPGSLHAGGHQMGPQRRQQVKGPSFAHLSGSNVALFSICRRRASPSSWRPPLAWLWTTAAGTAPWRACRYATGLRHRILCCMVSSAWSNAMVATLRSAHHAWLPPRCG